MKQYIRLPLLTVLLALIHIELSYAQDTFSGNVDGVRFEITTSATLDQPFTLNNQNFQVNAQFLTGGPFSNAPEPPYSTHLWVTIGDPANNEFVEAQVLVDDGPSTPNAPIDTNLSHIFRLPIIGNANPPNHLEPGLSAIDIVGQPIVITACLLAPPNLFAPNVNEGSCFEVRINIHPDQVNFLASPARSEANRATIYWSRLPTDPADNGQTVGDTHRLTLTNQNNPNDSVVLVITDGDDTAEFLGQERNRLILTDSPIGDINILTGQRFVAQPGVAYQATIEACSGFGSIGPFTSPLVCSEGLSISNVTRFAIDSSSFTASEGSVNNLIAVNWIRHSPDTDAYRLRRCEVNNGPCIDITPENNALFFVDDQVVAETQYQYTISACVAADCKPVGRTNFGFAGVEGDGDDGNDGIEDDFEADDSPQQLTQIFHTIDQSLEHNNRSFHEIDDQDWVRINVGEGISELEVSTTSSLPNVDTQLTLFDSNENIIACGINTRNSVQPHAQIIVPVTPGEYFIRAEQQPGGPLMLVENYTLTFDLRLNTTGDSFDFPCELLEVEDFPKPRPIIVPIFDLLLTE